jgi:hypothetical protein
MDRRAFLGVAAAKVVAAPAAARAQPEGKKHRIEYFEAVEVRLGGSAVMLFWSNPQS